MKMGTIASLWRYDTAARHALQSAKLRRPAILRYASRGCFSDLAGLSGHPPIAAVSINARIDVVGKNRPGDVTGATLSRGEVTDNLAK
jgi:hypothetical protein